MRSVSAFRLPPGDSPKCFPTIVVIERLKAIFFEQMRQFPRREQARLFGRALFFRL